MDTWIEERCEAIRLALRIAGFPEERDLLRLVDWLGSNVQLRHAGVAGGACHHWPDGSKSITLPQRLDGKPYSWELSHEIGHVLLSVGMASLLRQLAPECPQVERLARRTEAQDERRIRDFVLTWWMPSHLVQQYPDDYELAYHANVSVEMAATRRQRLGGKVIDLAGRLPRWSALNHYHCVLLRAPRKVALYVVRRCNPSPVFDFPAEAKALESDAMQINADLVALTQPEFDLKYAEFQCGTPEVRYVNLAELHEWARGKSG